MTKQINKRYKSEPGRSEFFSDSKHDTMPEEGPPKYCDRAKTAQQPLE